MNRYPESVNRHLRRRQQTRTALQAAMLSLVQEKGYEAVSIQDITDRADLGRGTFYIHFHDKEDLLWSMVQDAIRSTEQNAIAELGGSIPDQPEYYAFLFIFRHVNQHQQLYRVILGDKGSSPLVERIRNYMVQDQVNDILQFHLYPNLVYPPEIVAQMVIGALMSLAKWWLDHLDLYSAEQMAGVLYETLCHRKPPVSAFSGYSSIPA